MVAATTLQRRWQGSASTMNRQMQRPSKRAAGAASSQNNGDERGGDFLDQAPTAPLRGTLRYDPGRDAAGPATGIPRLIHILWALLGWCRCSPAATAVIRACLALAHPAAHLTNLDRAHQGRPSSSTRPDLIRRDWLDELTDSRTICRPSSTPLLKRSEELGLSRCTV